MKSLKIEAVIVGILIILSGILNFFTLYANGNSVLISIAIILLIVLFGTGFIIEGFKIKKNPLKHLRNITVLSILFLFLMGAMKIGGLIYLLLIGLALHSEHSRKKFKKTENTSERI
jgi:uncharacterized membrane protein